MWAYLTLKLGGINPIRPGLLAGINPAVGGGEIPSLIILPPSTLNPLRQNLVSREACSKTIKLVKSIWKFTIGYAHVSLFMQLSFEQLS